MESYCRKSLRFSVMDVGSIDSDVFVALHGFPQNAATWSVAAARLAEAGYRVLAPDQRGYSAGARPKRRRDYVLRELVDDVGALIRETRRDRVHLIGHDWGGVVAWALAHQIPEKIATLTVVSTPHPRAFTRTLFTGRQLRESWYMLFFQLPWLPEALLGMRDGRVLSKFLMRNGLNEQVARLYTQRMIADRGLLTGALNWYRALPLNTCYGLKVGLIRVPTLYVVGADDSFVSRDAAAQTERWVSGLFRCERIQGGTHWIPEERPDELAELIREFAVATSRAE